MKRSNKPPLALCAAVWLIAACLCLADPPAKSPIPWKGHVGLGYVQSSGNTESISISIIGELEKKREKDHFKASVFGNYGETDGEETTDKGNVSMRYSYFHTPVFFSYMEGALEYDDFQSLDIRTKIGAGVGWMLKDTPRTHLDVSIGGLYIDEQYQNSAFDDSYVALSSSLNLEHKLLENLTLTQKLTVDMSMEDSEDVLFISETGFRTMFAKHLSLTIFVVDKYDNNPPTDIDENDLVITTALGYSF